jgi:D-sedoheptulose 7-phosphate isomerase
LLENQEARLKNHIESSLREASSALDALLNNTTALQTIEEAAKLLIATFEGKGRVFSCGNGGSMCDAMHFAEELTGRYRLDRPALAATAISDVSHMSCLGNDYGYEKVFSWYIEAHGRVGDCLVALSTSGTSKNIIRAAQAAQLLGMNVIILSGKTNEVLSSLSTVYVCTPGGKYADRVQELHIKVLHIFIEMIERHLFPENYA